MLRVPVQPALFAWARQRARLDVSTLDARFPQLARWESGEAQPTLRQLEQYAQATHAPLGFFFLPAPPQETLPIPDFRTVGAGVPRVSADLLDVIYACQARQIWYRDEAMVNGEAPLPFVGSLNTATPPAEAARAIRQHLGFSVQARSECPTWTEALRLFIAQAEQAGVMVMVSGVVMNNNNRPLDPQEFRGFALSDAIAPLVFINGADSKSAQMFTLAHELAHLWLGQTAVSDAPLAETPPHAVETWCNQVAAQLLVPDEDFRAVLLPGEALETALKRLAKHFKVSTLVLLRRMRDVGWLDRATFWAAYRAEEARLQALAARSAGGGDFYRTTVARVGRRFAQTLVASTLEGRTLYRDAFRMLGIVKPGTFNELGRTLGFPT
ncbi:ImmA/IrrE family metallo-endopeptidase [Pseudacidovorax sp. RU35E]|uniref:ImmA/IrrE family metallo-endopeptidase n=1 Tax=Pseudacidovorax sp. RU35E TaxID=1907403 RepID=UPI0009562DD3|nr:ImmA/IrrE family metallo-endopeptidase [Pseudacidovorax sp. RU35E]SIQ37669.1 Zn-dependent peptidase ImmA, M78 family [Pseudacidovorax sp. RU35E]